MKKHSLTLTSLWLILIFPAFRSEKITTSKEKLIRVNEWQEIQWTRNEFDEDHALVDFHLFATCEKFSVIFMTENEKEKEKDALDSTQFLFSFYDVTLRKIDINSVNGAEVEVPSTPKLLGTCREKNRKILRLKIRTSNDSMIFKIDDQIIRRPFDSRSHRIKVLIPQKVACCLIRALFLSNADMRAYSASTGYELTTQYRPLATQKSTDLFKKTYVEREKLYEIHESSPPQQDISTSTITTPLTTHKYNDTNKWSKYTLGKNPTVLSSTSKPETSWTHAVNKQWSITFVLCSIVVCTIMLFLAVFGTFTVFYLMTKPSGGKSPYSVDA